MEILSTTQYDQFKYYVSNREVDQSHVRKLAASIQRKNLMHIRPALVNEELYVIDGQHRIEACKLINVPVYYLVTEGLTKSDIAILNTAQKNWTRLDFINFYAIEGKPEFITFSKLVNKFEFLRVGILLELVSNRRAKNVRDGELDLANIDRATVVCEWLAELYRKTKIPFISTVAFVRAFKNVIRDDDTFATFLLKAPDSLYRCASQPEYEALMRKILVQYE